MQSVAQNLPKCLIPVGDKPILERIIVNVLTAGAKEIGIVLGYRAAQVRDFVKKHFPFSRIRFMVNPKFESTNNAFSLLLARDFYLSDRKHNAPLQQLLLLDSDIVFSSKLIPFLLETSKTDVVAVRTQGEHDEEEIGVKTDSAGRILRIGKNIPIAETFGESIGIELFSPTTAEALFHALEKRVRQGVGRTEFYEASFQELIDSGIYLHAIDISDFPAAEIDRPEDLAFVEKHIIARIDSFER